MMVLRPHIASSLPGQIKFFIYFWQDILLKKLEETFLVGSDPVDIDMIVTDFGISMDFCEKFFGIRPAHDFFGHIFFFSVSKSVSVYYG